MITAFVSLIFGFCAAISNDNDSILFGYKSQGECAIVVELSDDTIESVVADQHTITWQWIEGGAEIAIDGQKFVITRIFPA